MASAHKEIGITYDDLLAYIVDNPNKVTEIEETLGYGNDSVKLKYLRKLLSSNIVFKYA